MRVGMRAAHGGKKSLLIFYFFHLAPISSPLRSLLLLLLLLLFLFLFLLQRYMATAPCRRRAAAQRASRSTSSTAARQRTAPSERTTTSASTAAGPPAGAGGASRSTRRGLATNSRASVWRVVSTRCCPCTERSNVEREGKKNLCFHELQPNSSMKEAQYSERQEKQWHTRRGSLPFEQRRASTASQPVSQGWQRIALLGHEACSQALTQRSRALELWRGLGKKSD